MTTTLADCHEPAAEARQASDVLLRLQTLEDYRTPREHIFPSRWSLAWTVRRHRDALIDAGALRCPNGRWLVDPTAFDSFVLSRFSKRGASGMVVPGACTPVTELPAGQLSHKHD